MNILVTGGTGFIGAQLVEDLLKEEHNVTVIGKSARPENLTEVFNKINYIQANIFTDIKLEEILKDIDIVYHLLWTSLPRQSFDTLLNDLHFNVSFGISLLQAAVNNKVKKVVFTSSGGTVYGITSSPIIKENHPLDPVSSYGVTKLAFEKYLQLFEREYGLQYTVFRVANAYGVKQDPYRRQGVISTWLQKILDNEIIEIWGDGNVVRDYIYVKDISSAMVKAINLKDSVILNLGSGKGYSLNQILREMELLIGSKIPVIYKPQHKNDVPVNILDIEKAKNVLEWNPEVSIQNGIKLTYEFLKERNFTYQK